MLAPSEKIKQKGLTHKRLLEVLDYCPSTGIFRWKISIGTSRFNDIAGTVNKKGYVRIKIDCKFYLGHRLAWFYMYGIWPKGLIDHKDTVKRNNWIDNLRDATNQESNRNRKVMKSSVTGLKGVSLNKNGKFRAYICLGSFDTKEEAAEVYRQAALKLHGEFAHYSLTIVGKLALNEK